MTRLHSGASAVTVGQGIDERLATVPTLVVMLAFEPTSVPGAPMVFSVFDRVEWAEEYPYDVPHYWFKHTLAVLYQDPATAELTVRQMVDAIGDAIFADEHLGGRLANGHCHLHTGHAGWLEADSGERIDKYRSVEFSTETWDF